MHTAIQGDSQTSECNVYLCNRCIELNLHTVQLMSPYFMAWCRGFDRPIKTIP
jgi:hypothetical protein